MEGKKKSLVGWFHSLFPNCKDTTLLIVKEQETHLHFTERFKMLFHVYIVCKFCRMFRKQSGMLHQHVHQMMKESTLDTTVFKLTDKQKRDIEDAINRQLSGT